MCLSNEDFKILLHLVHWTILWLYVFTLALDFFFVWLLVPVFCNCNFERNFCLHLVSCLFKFVLWNSSLQIEQFFKSFWWVLNSCVFRFELVLNTFSQVSNLNEEFPWTVSLCFWRYTAWENVLGQSEQARPILDAWILLWHFNAFFVFNCFAQTSQMKPEVVSFVKFV